MAEKRGILTALVLAALIVVGVAASWSLLGRLPEPASADMNGLLRWLALRDLADEPIALQQALVDRFQQLLLQGETPPRGAHAASNKHRRRVERNAELLRRVWFHTRTERLFDCPEAHRPELLDREIETVFRWSQLDARLSTAVDETPPTDNDSTPRLFAEIQQWIEQASGRKKEQMAQAVRLGVTRWLATGDLEGVPHSVRRQLNRRIIYDLEEGLQVGEVLDTLSPEQRRRIKTNGMLLVETWMLDQASDYRDAPAPQRPAFVDQQIDNILRWNVLALLTTPNELDEEPASMAEALLELMQQVETWIARAPTSEQESLRTMITAVQQRLLVRSLQGEI